MRQLVHNIIDSRGPEVDPVGPQILKKAKRQKDIRQAACLRYRAAASHCVHPLTIRAR